MSGLIDGFGRVHKDLRISLTDHCNLRCTYCMPAEGVPWLPRQSLLSAPELMRIVEVAVKEGISEVRLTGGEPLLRPDVVDVIAAINSIENAPEISITTNGIMLPRLAGRLAEAGLTRVNISLDTLDRARFKEMTRRDRLVDVLDGIDAAKAAGLVPVKINSVLMRGVNDHEAPALLHWAMENDLQLRFIEQMPLDAGHTWSREGMVTADEIMTSLRTEFDLEAIPGRGAAPAERFLINGGPHTVGIIASVTMPFCGACDRLRLTADGQLRSCLFSNTESDLREPLRSGKSDEEIAAILHQCLFGKLAGHGINEPGFLQPPRPMSAIGG